MLKLTVLEWFKYSSSLHALNADLKLNLAQKIVYFIYNSINNLFYFTLKHGFSIRYLSLGPLETLAEKLATESQISPSRFLSNEFWNKLDLGSLKEAMGEKLSCIEFGCGNGAYGKLLQDIDPSLNYVGVDIKKPITWLPGSENNSLFVQNTYANASELIIDKNLIITQSALEHFEKDLFLFAEIARVTKIKNQKLIQIHLFPSASCLKTFLWHGIRQYNYRTINKIVKISKVEETPILVCLGGPRSNSVHFKSITLNLIKKDTHKMYTTAEGYEFSLAKAIKQDEIKRKPTKASFYGLILQHNLQKKLAFEEFSDK